MSENNTMDLSEPGPQGMPSMPNQGLPGQKPQGQAAKPHHQSMISFGSPKKHEPSPEIVHMTSQVGELGRRIRILEDRYSNLRRKTQITDQNMLIIQKKINREIKTIDNQLIEVQKEISQLDEKMKQILREIQNFAKSDDIKVLKRYLDFWQPVGFITKSEAENLVRDIIEENRKI